MDNTITLWHIIVPAISGIIGIAIGSFKPILDWNIEIRKFRRQNRKELFLRIINTITAADFNEWEFLQSVDYSLIRPFLKKEIRHSLEFGHATAKKEKPTFEQVNNIRWGNSSLIDEINRIARKWKMF